MKKRVRPLALRSKSRKKVELSTVALDPLSSAATAATGDISISDDFLSQLPIDNLRNSNSAFWCNEHTEATSQMMHVSILLFC
jgi:hypothetical protein